MRWASEDDGPSTTMRRRVQKAATVLFEAPRWRARGARLLRWTRGGRGASTNAKVASDDRAVAGKISLDKLSSDEVHRFSEAASIGKV